MPPYLYRQRGEWKYVVPAKANPKRKRPARPAELYNLDQDPGEKENVFTSHPELGESMAQQLKVLTDNGRIR